MNFRFYDFLLNYVASNINPYFRDMCNFKNYFRLDLFTRVNLKQKLLVSLGFQEPYLIS